jgi:type VI secretion system protein ImpL
MNSGILTGRWAIGAVAWIAFSVAVWFVGDALMLAGSHPLEGALERLAVIVLFGGAWLSWEFWRARRAAAENERLLDGLVGGSLDADSAARATQELAALRKRFEEALAVLRKARFRSPEGERRTVSQLPWYMFIGAPGSGKTTALLNAGLRFPLGDPRAGDQALQGVGGTRNCDWWFTDTAVLVDTAGRYTTQESDQQADAAAWLGFLDLLKRFRARQPLNGLIVTLSVADLVHWNDEERARYARHVHERVSELYARLGMRLPIYLMITKTDLLAGFSEFFSEFDAKHRAQVWGTTFALTEQTRGLAQRFEEEFAHLERRLYTLLPERMQEARDLQKRAAIYRFPQQFRAAGPLIGRFLEGAFGGASSGETPLLRGVYFTSGTQEGSPIDRVLGTLARSFNLERKVQPPAAGAGKSYFLKRLLHDVAFGEAGLAGRNPAAERRGAMVRFTVYASFAGVTLACGLLWTASFFGNRELVAAAQAKAIDAKRELEALPGARPGDEAKLLAVLDRLGDLRRGVRGNESGSLHVGFYQGEKLGTQADRAYRNALADVLVPHLAASLESALRSSPSPTLLDGYINLHDDAKRDPLIVERAAMQAWKLPETARAGLAAHLREAFAARGLSLPRPRDQALVEEARRRMAGARTKT